MSDTIEDDVEIQEALELSFIERIKARVITDFNESFRFLDKHRQWLVAMNAFYKNSQNYESIRKTNKFPSTVLQEDVDGFVADAADKIFFANRPARVTGREATDKGDAEAKQALFDYQDKEDRIKSKIKQSLHDCGLGGICVAQVDYKEKTKLDWVEVPIPAVAILPNGELIIAEEATTMGIPFPVDETGLPVPLRDPMTGEVLMSERMRFELMEIPIYKGSTVKHVDPLNVYFGKDKMEIDDEFPIMIKSTQSKDFFEGEDYFFNQTLLLEKPGGGQTDPTIEEKNQQSGVEATGGSTGRPYDYIEWQRPVDRQELYEYLREKGELGKPEEAERAMATIKPGEKTWAICGLVDKETVVQLRENPFMLDRPNIIIGSITDEGYGLLRIGLGHKIEAVQRGDQDLLGMLMENLKQSIDAQWIINSNMILNPDIVVNEPGGVLLTNDDINKVAKRIDPPKLATDILLMQDRFKQTRQNQGGRQDILTGGGDPGTSTLGESNMVMSQALLRMRDYIECFEETFIRPLYEMRNHINAYFLDKEYVVMIAGKQGEEWRTIAPKQIKAQVHFICESSQRETNKAVKIQQMLQLIKIAPAALQGGQFVRFDRMMAELGRSGFSMTEEQVLEFFPLLRLEKEHNVNVDDMIFNTILGGLQQLPPGGQPGLGGPTPNPMTEEAAIEGTDRGIQQSTQPNTVKL